MKLLSNYFSFLESAAFVPTNANIEIVDMPRARQRISQIPTGTYIAVLCRCGTMLIRSIFCGIFEYIISLDA